MNLKQLTVKQSLNKAYRLIKPDRADIEKFKANFKLLLGHINPQESEENLKGHVMDFLKNTYFNPNYHIATKGRTDFVIHTSKDATHPAGVLFEAKKPSNHEMVTLANLNTKAMHEIILYYLRERMEHHNNDIRYLVITNIYEWFVFDAAEFERLFFRNSSLIKEYKAWVAKQKVSTNNDLFYNEIAKPFLASLTEEIEFTWFDIREFEKPLLECDKNNDNKLIPLFKILSPTHLLKLPFANDSNTLDKGFYNELLYLIGLEEVKEGSKKLIRRKQAGKRNDGSLLENTIVQLETENCIHKVTDRQSYGDTTEEQLFSVALELCITWVNRILFLKLLEAQLLKYHKGNAAYRFLNYNIVPQYDELYKLFFQVLARKQQERNEKVKTKYKHIPYLNSSLFEITLLEEQTIRINMLDDTAEMPLLTSTILKDDRNKPIATKLNTLQYIFDFLNAYDFASEGSEEIQEERKILINASVLGLIFEKINGYKDGSIFTPGFITMYMCRQSIRQAVVNKFKEKYNWKAETFEDLHNYISDDRTAKTIKEYNARINSLTICDPAVGSGHFLVSALNELIAIKSELGILADANGKRLSEHTATVENDELLITDRERNFFTYHVGITNERITIPNTEIQRVQETLFHEKQTIIENCLFGVDINPKSVQICRLRLWIELLKNAYYIAEGGNSKGELQTLPNIDINIKTGNSLISRFVLDEDLKAVFRQGKYSVETYKLVVQTYKDSKSKEEKSQLQNFVRDLKEQFRTIVYQKDPLRTEIQNLRGDLLLLTTANIDLFGKKKSDKEVADDVSRIELSLEKKEADLKEKENSRLYNNAFEWRFEFPEVLNDAGDYIGFDMVIGNPPYKMIQPHNTSVEEISIYKKLFDIADFKIDLFHLFFQLGNKILKSEGLLNFIAPSTLLYNVYTNNLRTWLKKQNQLIQILAGKDKIFDEAEVHTAIYFMKKIVLKDDYTIKITSDVKSVINGSTKFDVVKKSELGTIQNVWNLLINSKNYKLLSKISNHKKLDEIADINRGLITGDRDKYFSAERKSDNYVPILTGSDIYRYYHKPPAEYVLFERPKTAGGCWDPKVHFASYKLCIRQIGKEPTATLINKPFAVTGNIFTVIAPTEIIEKYLLAIINSSLIKYFWSILFYDFKSTFPQVTINSLNIIPVPDWDDVKGTEIVEVVDQIMMFKTTEFVDTSILEAKLDMLIFKLFGLNIEEIKTIERISLETRGKHYD